jgi:hypothetical protein
MLGRLKQAAKPLMRRSVRQQEMPSLGAEWDALTWLNLWDWNDPATENSAFDDLDPFGQNQHLSL